LIYCINPWCPSRRNEDTAEHCLACDSPLLINGRFKLLRPLFELNRLHFCDVYDALDVTGSWLSPPNTVKILKVLKEYDEQNQLVSMMQREAKVLQLLNHPCIPKADLDDFFSITLVNGPGPLFCLAMTRFDGITLAEWVRQHGRIDQALALNWLRQLADILHVVHSGINEHSSGYIHRDIKPTNIMVQPQNTLALIDFGGVRQTTNTYYAKVAGSIREPLTLIGSHGFTAPEQIDGKVVPQSDFYSLGRTFIFALTGKDFSDIPRDDNTGKLLWRQFAKHIDLPILDFIDDLTHPAVARRPKNTQEILSILDNTLLRRLKRSRLFRSKWFRFGSLFLTLLFIVSGLHFARRAFAENAFTTGLKQFNSNQLAEAQANFERSISFYPTEDAYINLGYLCERNLNANCAKTSYNKAISINPQSINAYSNLGSVYEDEWDYKSAIAYYRKAVELSRHTAPVPLNNLSRLLILQGDYVEAKFLVESALKLKLSEPKTVRSILLKNLGWIYFKQKRYAEAKNILNQSIDLSLNLASNHCLLAQVLEAQKQFANSEWRYCMTIESEDAKNIEVFQWRSLFFDHALIPH
jgi:serine/threonine protein kinase